MDYQQELYQANEQRVNRMFLYLLYGAILTGAILMLTVKLLSLVKASFSYWNVLYMLGAGLAIMAIPTYLYWKKPTSPLIKYFLVGGNIIFVAFINVLLAKLSDSNFLCYFWAIIFSTLYFDKKTTLFALLSSVFTYLVLVTFIPVVRPAGFQSFQSSVMVRIFYLGVAGTGCIVITNLANRLLKRIIEQETITQIAFNNLNDLLANISATGMTLASSSQELAATTEETSASMEETSAVVATLAAEAMKTRIGMTDAQQLLNSLAERAEDHQSLTEKTVNLTAQMAAMAEEGSANTLSINQAVEEVVHQFDATVKTIAELNEDSQNIGKIVQTINNIVEQTKMLSMNASIEAARAGEYGRGFAVVANKIRKLSDETQDTLKQIETIVHKFLPRLDDTVAQSRETAILFDQEVRTVLQVNETFSRILNSLQEGLPLLQNVVNFLNSQTKTIKEIDEKVTDAYQFSVASEDGMQNLNQVIEELTGMTQTLASSSQQLSTLAQTMTEQAKANIA